VNRSWEDTRLFLRGSGDDDGISRLVELGGVQYQFGGDRCGLSETTWGQRAGRLEKAMEGVPRTYEAGVEQKQPLSLISTGIRSFAPSSLGYLHAKRVFQSPSHFRTSSSSKE
jgi:hypothetical protein